MFNYWIIFTSTVSSIIRETENQIIIQDILNLDIFNQYFYHNGNMPKIKIEIYSSKIV